MDYSKYRVPELKGILSGKGLPTSGNKAELILRLQSLNYNAADDVGPSDSVSQMSGTSTRSARIRNEANRAVLEAKLRSVNKKHSLQMQQLQVQSSLEQVELEIEIEASIAEDEVLSKYDDSVSHVSTLSETRETVDESSPVNTIVLPLESAMRQSTPVSHEQITPMSHGQPALVFRNASTPALHDGPTAGQTPPIINSVIRRPQGAYVFHSPLIQRTTPFYPTVPMSHTQMPTPVRATAPLSQRCVPTEFSPLRVIVPPTTNAQETTFAAPPPPHLNTTVNYAGAATAYEQPVAQTFQSQVAPNLLAAITESVNLPKPELLSFNGKAKDYFKFIVNFETNLASKVTDYRLKLSYLIQLCNGEPKQLIEDCVLLEPEEGYFRACDLLSERYGRAHTIARSHIDSLIQGPVIKANDVQGLVKLSQDMQTCELTLSKLGYLADENSTETLRCIVNRLPYTIRGKWVEVADGINQSKKKEPEFSDLCLFVKGRARVASSMYGQEFASDSKVKGQSQDRYSTKKSDNRPHKVTTLVTQSDGAERVKPTGKYSHQKTDVKGRNPTSRERGKGCRCCGDNHLIVRCPRFTEWGVDKRREFIKENEMCFNCLYYGHLAIGCLRKSRCSQCGRKHHELVHDEGAIRAPLDNNLSESHKVTETQPKRVNEGSVNCTSSHGQRIALRILPVIVEYGGKSVETYALLDCGSDVTLCDERLINELSADTTPVSFNIATINQTSSVRHGSQATLTVKSLDCSESIKLDKVWSVDHLPVSLGSLPSSDVVRKWPHLSGISFPQIRSDQVTLLIGSDVPEAFWSLEERRGQKKEPYAIRSLLGWTLIGPTGEVGNGIQQVNFQQTDVLQQQLEMMWKTDFSDSLSDNRSSMSVEDKHALKIMEETVTKKDGKFMLSLPWRHSSKHLPNNKALALSRLRSLHRKLQRDDALAGDYRKTMHDYIDNGYARKITATELNAESAWYLPHHPVVNPNKPGKVRVVFDCAAKYKGVSLNDQLLQGPDFMNSLVGVLIRFRQEPVAIVSDIEAMFHQVKVTNDDCNYLRFLWWDDGDLSKPPSEYCMTVHLFGATSSPSCTSFCLKRTAEDNRNRFSEEAIKTLERSFYVDDSLKSTKSVDDAISLVSELRSLLQTGGFRLRKWISNSREVLASIPEDERATSVANLCFDENLPFDRTLGLQWDIENDCFTYDIKEKSKPLTRRGLLSLTSSLYDPLGFVAPVTLSAKLILQSLCRKGLQWDEPIPDCEAKQWAEWDESLSHLSTVRIPRCIKPATIGIEFSVELHHFADGSEKAYGTASYVKVYDNKGHSNVSLLMGKARLAPLKTVSIPRLELSAAVVAVRMHQMIMRELDLKVDKSVFWTDSESTLKCIHNTKTRFKTFVANRLAVIHDATQPQDWRYVPSELNPADVASRGIQPNESTRLQFWLDGPEFLKDSEECYPTQPELTPSFEEMETEVKNTFSVTSGHSLMDRLICRHSSWFRLQKSVAWLLRFKQFCRRRFLSHHLPVNAGRLTIEELSWAEKLLLKHVQRQSYGDEIKHLSASSDKALPKSSALRKLCPIYEDGLLRVGGRMQYGPMSYEVKHPVILPQKHHLAHLIIQDFHSLNGHVGPHQVLALIRSRIWIVNGMASVKRVIGTCFECRRRNQPPCKQQMAPLPEERLTPDKPPFAYVGIDFFGPMYVKYGRGQCKRYGCLFTCLATRAVHIEISHSMDTNSFLGALNRFISRRGKPCKVFSDNGTNFTSGEKELNSCLSSWNQAQIHDGLLQQNIEWHFIPPSASHMGGIWERIVRSVKNILKALVKEQLLSDEALLTFAAEVERILNDRPITPLSNDTRDPHPLTPNKLLQLRCNSSLPFGLFTKTESYYTRWWKQVQYLANIFWRRWLKEYLPLLQTRDKWARVHTNLKEGDIVLVVDEQNQRGQWPLGIITGVNIGRDKLVRSVKVRSGNSTKVRPVTKICLLEGC